MISSIVSRSLNTISLQNLRNGSFSKIVCTIASRNCSSEDDCCEAKLPDCKRDDQELLSPKCKVALITGGSSGIGFAVATELLCAGARNVVIVGDNACQGKEAANMLNSTFGSTKAMFVKGNVGCIVQLEDAFKRTIKAYKHLDILVNCAGVIDGCNWEREFVTNVIGTVRGTLLAYKYIGTSGNGKGGVIVNVSGIQGLEPLPPAPTLCACWHAIVGFSRSFGDESHVKRSGVRVIALCPGFTSTDFIKRLTEKGMTEVMGKELENFVKGGKKQKPDVGGRAIMHLITKGKSGTVWWLEASKLYSLEFPKKECFSTLETQYI